jgi:hypothetical protein
MIDQKFRFLILISWKCDVETSIYNIFWWYFSNKVFNQEIFIVNYNKRKWNIKRSFIINYQNSNFEYNFSLHLWLLTFITIEEDYLIAMKRMIQVA